MAAVSIARKAAFEILQSIDRGRAHADELLRRAAVDALPAPDRNLVHALVFGVLRWQLWLDRQIRPLLKRPEAKVDSPVLIALRLGAFQLIFLDRVPAHATIDESVELVKQSRHRFASGMVNAVLRRLASTPPLTPLDETGAGAAPEQAHPTWMVERWVNFYGREATMAICRHGQAQPTVSLRLAAPDVEDELTRAGIRLGEASLLNGARTVVSGNVTTTDAYRAGRARIQDEGSQLIAEIASSCSADLAEIQGKFLDTCAAPGGKTLILAERHPEARIVACEWNVKRLAELRDRLHAYVDRIECRHADAASLSEESVFDLVLADVPCSGTGTLGRNPEIRHRLLPEDLPRQAERQRAILHAALRAVRPGGRVVYSTCSLESEENEEVVRAVLAEDGKVRQISVAPQIERLASGGIVSAPGAEYLRGCLTSEGALRLLPGTAPTDGFYVALMERVA